MNVANDSPKNVFSKTKARIYNFSDADPLDFAPALVRLQDKPAAPLGPVVLKTVIALFGAMLLWAAFGRLDIVAVAQGKLVPQTYLKIVQPTEQGSVQEILVKEGAPVKKGQVLIRMDEVMSDADGKTLTADYHRHRLALRRIDAELDDKPLLPEKDDAIDFYSQTLAQYDADRRAHENALDEQRSVLEKAEQELAAAREVEAKLVQVLPHFREQAKAFSSLSREGVVARLDATDKQRELIEKEQDLKSQQFIIKSDFAIIAQVRKKIAQITADYQRQLQVERAETSAQFDRVRQELTKQQHQHELLELKAPQDGIIKDLATHTVGTVVNPGTILMTLVPLEEPLRAEVLVSNEDIGFIRPGQKVKIKLSAFTFQKYGMLDGVVEQIGADAIDGGGRDNALDQGDETRSRGDARLFFKTLVSLSSQRLRADGQTYTLTPGMQVAAEIKLGTRSVLEYLFSPVTKAFHESGRER